MSFNIGSELDKQIYKEGDCTWGCKDGWLDVEDVKRFIEEIKEEHEEWRKEGVVGSFFDDSFKFKINKLAGKGLI